MRKIAYTPMLTALMLCAFWLIGATPSHANARCDSLVYDAANVFGSQTSDVQAAIKSLEERGIDGRAISIPTFSPSANLDSYIENFARSCASWQQNGQLKINMVVIIASIQDRKVMIYYGDSWTGSLGANNATLRIQSEVMLPKFRSAKYADGYIDAAKAIGDTVVGVGPFSKPINGSVPQTPSIPREPAQPQDWSGFLAVLLWIFAASVAIAACVALWIYLVKPGIIGRQRTDKKRDKLKQLIDTLMQLEQRILSKEREVQREKQISNLEKSESVDIAEVKSKLMTELSALQDALTTIGVRNGPKATRLNEQGLDDLIKLYSDTIEHARKVDAIDTALIDLHRRLMDKIRQASEDLTSYARRVAELSTELLLLRQEKSINTDHLSGMLGAVSQAIIDTESDAGELTVGVLKARNNAKGLLEKVETAITMTNQDHARVQNGPAALQKRLAEAQAMLVTAGESFARISATYCQSSWRSVRGNGTEAENRVLDVEKIVQSLSNVRTDDQTLWPVIIEQLDRGDKSLLEVFDLLKAITDREHHLATAKATSQSEIDAATADIQKARAYIAEHNDDVPDSLDANLEQAQTLLEQAKDELAKGMPDYLVVVDRALKANRAADSILVKAASEHEGAERDRGLFASTIQLTESTISKAANFISNHRNDVEESADRELANAKKLLRDALEQITLDKKLKRAQAALDASRDAYRLASNDFNTAEAIRAEAERRRKEKREEEEREARRRRESSYSSSSSSSTTIYGGSWGSSRSTPSSFGGGGSSSSFGGGFGGGGASSGW